MTPKHSFECLWAGLVLGFVIGFFTRWIACVIIAAALLQYLVFFRCPHCGKHLDRGLPDYCPKCGAELFWN